MFGGGVDHAGVVVPVADDGGAGGDEGVDVGGGFPAVGGEEEVDCLVGEGGCGGEVVVDDLAGRSGAV